jgi:tetratricopeptide (TPR) repeat protein
MTTKRLIHAVPAALALAVSACSNAEFTHVKPGNSARAHLEAKNAPPVVPVTVNQPGALPIPAGVAGTDVSSANIAASNPPLPLPDIPGDPALPEPAGTADKVADLFTRGTTLLKAGQTGEAILAFEETVKLDPAFADAWTKLAAAYSKAGQDSKAIGAYKMAKKLGQAGGANSGGGVLIP